MIFPEGGLSWKSAKARIPPYRAVRHQITRTRLLTLLAVTVTFVILNGGSTTSSREMQKYVSSYPWA